MNGIDGPYSEHGRSSSGSEVVVITSDHLPQCISAGARDLPNVSNMNIENSKNVQIGPKIQNKYTTVHNNTVTKEFSCGKYLWHLVRFSTCAERVSCTLAVLLVAVCAGLIIYFTLFYNTQEEVPDIAPAEWYITRDMWLAEPYNHTQIAEQFEPLRLVVIQHSVSPECYRFEKCASELRNLQGWFIKYKDRDIPYNFIIGNDGRAYEGRGWGVEGAHTLGYNRCSVGIGFVGDYREEKGADHTRVNEAQQNRTKLLLAEGVKLGYLHPDYLVVGAKDLTSSESPGSNLYKAIQKWKHYDHKNRYKNMTCEDINASPATFWAQ